jgi:hypothetical protein
MNYYNTSSIEYEYARRCLFCDGEIKVVTHHWDEREYDDYYPCTCYGAIKEQELIAALAKAKNDIKQHIANAKNANSKIQSKKLTEDEIEKIKNSPLMKLKEFTCEDEI